MTNCGQLSRNGRWHCDRPAVAVLQIGSPAAQLGACDRHLSPLVLEYLQQRGAVQVVRPDVLT